MDYNFSDIKTTTGAKADGKSKNNISFTLMNGSDYAKAIKVKLSLSNNALFSENNMPEVELTTNTLGYAGAAFTDMTAEEVTVSMVMSDNEDVNATAVVNFMQADQKVKSIFLLVQEDDAKADGTEQNVVAMQAFDAVATDTDMQPVMSVTLGLSLSNGAIFQDGSNKTTVTTSDDDGTASLSFTNITTGKTKVTAFLPSNLSISQEIDFNFKEVKPDVSTTLAVTSNNAIANGKSFNQIEATVLNKSTNKPESNISVTFTISNGSSTFIDGATTFTNTSDAEGKVYARLISQTAGTSNVVAQTYTGASNSEYVDFTENYSELEIVRIYNEVKSFSESGLTTAWPNATFYVEASGGSGDFTWNVNEESEVKFENQDNFTAIFIFTSNAGPNKTYTITVTDNVTKKYTTHTFTLDAFFSSFGDWNTYNLLSKAQYPSIAELTSLYNEWGDMSKYAGWLIENGYNYWTNTETLGWVKTINLKTGKMNTLFALLTLCGVAVKKK